MKYRTLTAEDQIQFGDEYHASSLEGWTTVYTYKYIGRSPECRGVWRRPIKEHNWISFKDRRPTKEDAYFSLSGLGYNQNVLYRFQDGSFISFAWDDAGLAETSTHWMPLNFIEDEPPRVKVRNEEVIPQKDGSIKINCTTISKQDMDEIIRQREEAMK